MEGKATVDSRQRELRRPRRGREREREREGSEERSRFGRVSGRDRRNNSSKVQSSFVNVNINVARRKLKMDGRDGVKKENQR